MNLKSSKARNPDLLGDSQFKYLPAIWDESSMFHSHLNGLGIAAANRVMSFVQPKIEARVSY